MAETDNWKDQLQPKIADEAEFIVNAFCDPDPKYKRRREPPCRGKVIKVVPDGHGGIVVATCAKSGSCTPSPGRSSSPARSASPIAR